MRRARRRRTCVWARGMRWPYGRHRERSRGAAVTTSSHGGEGLCAKEITWVPVPERTGRGFPGPWRLRSNDGPCCDGCRGGILPDSASAALCDLISWPANRPVMSEWAVWVTPPGGPSPSWGPEAAFQKLILSLLLFQKLPRFFLLFFPQGYCTVSLSAFLRGVIIALSLRSWVTSPRVKEKLDGWGGKSRSKPCPQWEPGVRRNP